VTINDQGTSQRTDDTLLAGATYAVIPDDGDGVFERDQDGPAVVEVSDPNGIAVLQNLPPIPYWVVETVAPPGFDLAAAVPYRPGGTDPAQSCFDAGAVTCYADAAGGGMTTVFFVNTPLPTASSADDYRSPIVIVIAIIAAILIGGAVVSMVMRRRAVDQEQPPEAS
jgi:hypothetical protein